MKITRLISLTNFVVASSALGFQVFVLYPWHNELDARFEDLRREHLRVLDAVRDKISSEQREGLRERIEELGSKKRRWF